MQALKLFHNSKTPIQNIAGQLVNSVIWKKETSRTMSNISTPPEINDGIIFARVLLNVRGSEGVAKSVNFYQQGLGMDIIRHTDEWAELSCSVGGSSSRSNTSSTDTKDVIHKFRLNLKGTYNEAELSVGYTPFICFDVKNMDETVTRCLQMGAQLDGPIQYPAHGKVATIRAPDGHMIGLYEPAFS